MQTQCIFSENNFCKVDVISVKIGCIMTQEKSGVSHFSHTTAAELRHSTFFFENSFFQIGVISVKSLCIMTEEKCGVSHRKISHAISAELRLSSFFCKVDVIVWQNLMHYDKEEVLVSTEILLGGYCGGFKEISGVFLYCFRRVSSFFKPHFVL